VRKRERKWERDRETERQRDRETERQRKKIAYHEADGDGVAAVV